MPTIEIYVDNTTHITFIQKKEEERARIRKAAQTVIKEETHKRVDKHEHPRAK